MNVLCVLTWRQILLDEQFMGSLVESSRGLRLADTRGVFANSPWMTDPSRVASLESVLWSLRPSTTLDLAVRVAQDAVARAHTVLLPVAARTYEVYALVQRLPCLHPTYSQPFSALLASVTQAVAGLVARLGGARAALLSPRSFRDLPGGEDVASLRVVGEMQAAATWHAFAAVAGGMLAPHRIMLAVALSLRVLRSEGRISVRDSRAPPPPSPTHPPPLATFPFLLTSPNSPHGRGNCGVVVSGVWLWAGGWACV